MMQYSDTEKVKETIFLNERFMAAICVFIVASSLISLVLFHDQMSSFGIFESLVLLVAAFALFLAFIFYKWDIAKGLMGGILFSLMYHEAYLVLNELWVEENFDMYLSVGLQGSLYIASAAMCFLLTIIITINHFMIAYDFKGSPKNTILAQTTIIFKFVVYVLLFIANSQLGFTPAVLWRNACQFLTNIAVLILLICVESHFDTFKILRQEILAAKRKGGKADE